jgi:hypothetical protein
VRLGALIALLIAATPACVITSSTNEHGGSGCPKDRPFEPGETVDGVAPEQALAPYFGTWQGPLTWLAGGSTELTLTLAQDPEQPLELSQCATGVHTDAIVSLTTEDGTLNDRLSASVWVEPSVPATLPDYSYSEQYSVSPKSRPLSEWQGTLSDKIPWLDRYEPSSVQVQLELGARRLKLASAALVFSGAPLGASSPDRIEFGTWSPQ